MEELFEQLRNEFQNEKIIVKEVSIAEIQNIRPGFVDGCFLPYVLNNKYDRFEILIDETLEYEAKISVLLHEMGHVKLSEFLGFEEVDRLVNINRPEWTEKTEFHAFKNQLEEGAKLMKIGHKSILVEVINNIKNTYENKNTINPYKLAIQKIFKEPIWNECILLIMEDKV